MVGKPQNGISEGARSRLSSWAPPSLPPPRPSTSRDHLTHLTFSPQWSINVRVRAKVGHGGVHKSPRPHQLSVACVSIIKMALSILHYIFKLHSKCTFPFLYIVLHASVPRLTPTHAFESKTRPPVLVSHLKKKKKFSSSRDKCK